MRLRIIKSFLFVVTLLFFTISCTQQSESGNARLRFAIPTGNSSLSGNLIIGFAAINIHHPAYSDPIVVTKDFHDNSAVSESDLIIEVTELDPTDNGQVALIQFLAVMKDTTNGTERFAYGDISMPILAGDNSANITSAFIGSSSKSGNVVGRYLTSPTDGPSGVLIGSFLPPGDKPPMDVIKTEMYNGWFELMVLEGTDALFDYRFEDSGLVLFDDINIAHFDSMVSSSPNHVSKVVVPSTYHREATEPDGARDLFYGFFSNTTANLTGKSACYLNHTNPQSIPQIYKDASLNNPLFFTNNTITAGEAYVEIGGSAQNYNDLYADNVCDLDSGNYINMHPSRLFDREGGEIGMNGPFRSLKPHLARDFFSNSSFNSGSLSIDINWSYLPGITTASVDGVSIFAKYSPNNSSSDNSYSNEEACDELAAEDGMILVGDVVLPAASYSFTGDNSLAVSSSNYHDWRFRICPFKEKIEGRHYMAGGIRDHCRGGCQDSHDFGRSLIASYSVTTGNFHNSGAGDMHGAHARISTYTSNANHTLISTPATAMGTFGVGKEIMLIVNGEENNGCGDYNVGHFESTISLNVAGTSPVNIKIPKGSFIEDIAAGSLSATPLVGSPFCYVQVVQVPHYQDLSINSAALSPLPFSYSDDGGGIVAFRVSGTLTLNQDISVNALGYRGGAATEEHGEGTNGPRNPSMATDTGGQFAGAGDNGGGGGGFNSGGGGASGGSPGSGGSGFGNLSSEIEGLRMQFGGGGAMGGTALQNGGAGGGAIFIAAKNILNNSGASRLVSASGGNGGSNGGFGSGGGGAGSVNVIAENFSGNAGIDIEATGGGGGATNEGGGGGGGFISYGFCNENQTVNFDNSAIITTGDTLAQDGNLNPQITPHFCN